MSHKAMTIAIDAMGGDRGVKVTVLASVNMVKRNPQLSLILVGDEGKIQRRLAHYKMANHDRLLVHHASEVVAMDEPPALALRGKKDSSMRVSINLVKEGKADAAVSAGNTGALMATARFVLKMIPGLDRPAIVYAIPALNDQGQLTSVYMLDLGANIECTAEHLFEFAVMGSVLAAGIKNIDQPRVSLLNIGEEDIKGLDYIKEAAQKLSKTPALNYTGFIEGNHIFQDKADVVVCDGFVGNVALKTMEGAVRFVVNNMKQAFNTSSLSKCLSIFALPVLLHLKKKLDIRRFNGASFLGLRGIVIKSHGSADEVAFATAIEEAMKEVEKDIPNQIRYSVIDILGTTDDTER